MAKKPSRTPEQIREEMKEFCLREVARSKDPQAYVSALSSAAHLCDQVSREAGRKAVREAATECGNFIWEIYEAARGEAARQRTSSSS